MTESDRTDNYRCEENEDKKRAEMLELLQVIIRP
jgi:hypothetical protein